MIINDQNKPVLCDIKVSKPTVKGKLFLEESDDDSSDSFVDDHDQIVESTDSGIPCSSSSYEQFQKGDCVKIIKGAFEGYYAKIMDKIHDQYEINYFEKRYGKYVLKDFDLDSRSPEDFKMVVHEIDCRSRL